MGLISRTLRLPGQNFIELHFDLTDLKVDSKPQMVKWFSGAAVIKFNGSASGALLLNLAMLIEFQVTILFLVNDLLKLLMSRPSNFFPAFQLSGTPACFQAMSYI